MTGAAIAITTIITTMNTPTMPSGWLRAKRTSARPIRPLREMFARSALPPAIGTVCAVVLVIGFSSLQADSGIEHRVEQVHHQVHRQDDEHEQQRHRLNHRVV